MQKILWVKFGWSDYYRGGPIDGNFGWLNDNRGRKKEGRGHEAFNFLPVDGTYYCYVPPQAEVHAPSNDDPNGWTVICLAKHPKRKGIHIVGWYENATLHGDWLDPPSDRPGRSKSSAAGYDWSYCITSKSAFFVPPELRNRPFSDTSVRRGKYSFLAGPDVVANDNKKRVLRLLEQGIQALRPIAIRNPDEGRLPDPEIDPADPLKGFGTAEHRKKVEKAAERTAIEHFASKGYTERRVTHLPCGYDFVFSKGKTEMHVEVKGTASDTPQFFLTRNEFNKGCKNNPVWQLAMVTSALSDDPKVKCYSPKELREAFEMEPYVYLGRFLPAPKSD